jgi:hypothetical protein
VRACDRLHSLKQDDVNDDWWNRGRIAVQMKLRSEKLDIAPTNWKLFFSMTKERLEDCQKCVLETHKSILLLVLQHCMLHTLPYHLFSKQAYKTLISYQMYRDMQVDSTDQLIKPLFSWVSFSYKQSILAWSTNYESRTLLVASSVHAAILTSACTTRSSQPTAGLQNRPSTLAQPRTS